MQALVLLLCLETIFPRCFCFSYQNDIRSGTNLDGGRYLLRTTERRLERQITETGRAEMGGLLTWWRPGLSYSLHQ